MFYCYKLTLQIIFSILWMFSIISCGSLTEEDKASISEVNNTVSVCQLAKESSVFFQKDVTIMGELTGFHHLIFTDSSCENQKTAILIGMDKGLRQEFVEKVEKEIGLDKAVLSGNFHLVAVIKGKLEYINYDDSKSKCYVSKEENLIKPVIEHCLSVSSIVEIRLPISEPKKPNRASKPEM